MDRKVELKIYKEKSILDITEKNALYCIKADDETTFRIFVTDKFGNIVYLKDDTGTGGGGTITNIISSDATLEISGTTVKDIKIASSVLTTINNALQPGDNVSALLNDANYITLADIPAFNPSDYDLSDFTNTSGDPFARISDIVIGGGISTIQEGTGITVDDTDPQNPIVSSSTNLSYTASPTQGTITSDTGNDATIPLANNTNAGLFSPTEKSKLSGIEANAEVNNISDTNATDLTDGGDTTLHHHDSRYYTETETDSLLNNKVDKVIGKQLSTEDYTTAEKNKLALITGTNTGDETTSSIQTKRPLKTINGDSIEGSGNLQIDYNDLSNLPTIPDVSGFVPYTGATADVDLDNFNLNAKGLKINGTDGLGHLGLKHQSTNASAGGQETVIFAGNDGEPRYKNDGGAVEQFASRAWVLAQGFLTSIANATASVAGIAKLYTSTGSNTDGSMTQKAVTDALNTKENTITAGTTAQYYRGDKTFQPLNIAAVSGLQTALDGKADDPVVTDISLTSTIVGWSSFTRREITVVDYGACVLVIFALEGVSNSASSNFTLPFANAGGLTSNYIRTVNNSINQTNPGNATIVAGSSVVVLNVNNTGGVFTASGNKSTIGQILIRK